MRAAVHLQLLLLAAVAVFAAAQSIGEVLPPTPTYMVLVPRKMRPDQELRISTTVFRLLYESLTFRVSIRNVESPTQEKEVVFGEDTFYRIGTRTMRIKVPENVPNGNYSLHVEGSVKSKGGLVFYNRTDLIFEPKQFSMFIQFSRPVYSMGHTVRFRVIPFEANLQPRHRVFTSVEVVDSQGTTVRRWISPRSNALGFLELAYQLPKTSNFGKWKVRCRVDAYVSEKNFLVEFNTQASMISVNVTMPQRSSQFAYGIYGMIEANHTTNTPAIGNATIRLQIWPRNREMLQEPMGVLWKTIPYFSGKSEFLFTMGEIQDELKLTAPPSNLTIRADAYVFDWYYLTNQSSHAYSVLFPEFPEIRFLNGRVAQFKPGFPFTAMVLVYQPSGQTPEFRYRSVKIDVYCNRNRLERTASNIPIPDDSVVRYTFETNPSCVTYRIVAQLHTTGGGRSTDIVPEQFVFRHYSPSGSYMRVTSLTDRPTVDRYMVFNVRTNYYAPQIHIMILAGGNIMYSDILQMKAGVQSKTFSVAISRDMAPVARVVAYFMRQDGELVTDSLSFAVSLLGINSVNVRLTEGSDLTGQTVTGWLTGATPGSFAVLSAMPYDLFLRYGSSSILQPSMILEELRSYELHAEQPMRYRWFNDSSDVAYERHFPNPTLGPDANKTMNYSGLIMFTDSNYTKVSFWHTCNETENPNRAFPCYSASFDECFSRKQKCDGNLDCTTGFDEMSCESETDETLPGYVPSRFQFEYRHFDYDESWLWQQIYIKPFPDGRMPIHQATVPKLETAWTIGAVVLDREKGLLVQNSPTIFTTRRQFYMRLEAPKSAIWGEQIGVRVALFNRWDYWTEVIVELKRSSNIEFVQVGAFGQVDSYAPQTLANVSAHTVVYLRAGAQRTVYFPILPRIVGDNVVTFCAYAFNGGECSSITVSVAMNGVANSYHSPILLDLVSQSELLAQMFHILPEETFVEPERRWRRFVPGSKSATFTVVGDIVGPAFSADMPVGTSDDIIWKPHGSAESILFNINWNVQMLHYLRLTKQLKKDIRQRALEYVNTEFGRLAFYINPVSGGIANFPERFINETSSFMTAFGLWTLAETAFSQWEQTVSISGETFRKMLQYLADVQQSDGDPELLGSFDDSVKWDMKYFDTYLRDERYKGGNRTILSRVSTTSMVVIAVSHSSIPKPLSNLAEVVARRALAFLRRHIAKIDLEPLGLSMAAYALTFDTVGAAKYEAANMLRQTVRTDNYLYWGNRRVRKLIREPDSAGRTLIKPRVEWPNDALSVQATSLAMMTLFKLGNPQSDAVLRTNITQMMNFILETKNTPHGWISTQDTIFAVRALREVAQLDFNREIYQMKIDLVPSADITKATSFIISGSNLSVPQSVTLGNDIVWGEVTVQVSGSGRAVVQLNAQKSVENDFQVKNAADPLDPSGSLQTFEMSCQPTFSGRNASIIHMRTCGRWVWTDRSETSGMAVMSYTVPTGYMLPNYYLRNFVQNSNVRGLRHIWMDGGTMNIFFTNLTSTEQTCVTLDIPRWFPVANTTIEQSCSVYEYFEYDNGNFTIYNTRSLFTNDICQVCGSFQCPYCIDFNSANIVAAGSATVYLIVSFLMHKMLMMHNVLAH